MLRPSIQTVDNNSKGKMSNFLTLVSLNKSERLSVSKFYPLNPKLKSRNQGTPEECGTTGVEERLPQSPTVKTPLPQISE